MADVVVEAQAVDMQGGIHRLEQADMDFSYRHCGIPDDWIFVAATLRGEVGERSTIAARMGEIKHARETSQPLRSRTGGSTFVNPEGAKAWELIDRAGCRGLKRGAAMVSEQHCNFLINTGAASAADIEALGEDVRRRVADVTGVTLEWEIRRVGHHAEGAGPSREGGA
jgi:UDP-N-acetylmuramate dehydrogenase